MTFVITTMHELDSSDAGVDDECMAIQHCKLCQTLHLAMLYITVNQYHPPLKFKLLRLKAGGEESLASMLCLAASVSFPSSSSSSSAESS